MADPTVTARAEVMHRRLERELDDLMAGGTILDPDALRRLRAVIDAVIPVADAYAEQVVDLAEGAVA